MDLHLDFETRSAVELKSAGVYRYAEDPSTDVWCCAYSGLEGGIEAWVPGDRVPTEIHYAFENNWRIIAHNAQFERTIWRLVMAPRYGWPLPADDQWHCTAAMAAAMSLPRDLDGAANALGLPVKKDSDGRRLMLQMARPRGYVTEKPRVANQRTYRSAGEPWTYIGRASKWGNPYRIGEDGTREEVIRKYRAYLSLRGDLMSSLHELRGHTLVCHCHPLPCHGDVLAELATVQRRTWYDDRARIDRLIAYCKQDVEVERALDKLLLPLIPAERRLFLLDQQINDRGILVDLPLVDAAREVVEKTMKRLDARIDEATGGAISRTTQVARITRWLQLEGVDAESLDKASMAVLLAQPNDPDIQLVLETRSEAAKSSTSKLKALAACAGADGRARGLLQFLGAQRTGRFAGRLAQPQNFPRGSLPKHIKPEDCIPALLERDDVVIDAIWAPPLAVVSSTLRSMFMAAPGRSLIAADYANIEGRVLAWLAGEKRAIETFRAYDEGRGPDPYRVAAADIYHVSTETVTDSQRTLGKVAILALGFQGGVGAFQTMAANYDVSIPDEQANEIKNAWRQANPAIVGFWYACDRAAADAVRSPGTVIECGPVRWVTHKNFLWCRLPSGRRLCYAAPSLKTMRSFTLRDGTWFSVPEWKVDRDARVLAARAADQIEAESYRSAVCFMGVDSLTKRWTEHYGYGGLWAENITQAVARDVMAEGMLRLDDAGYRIVLTVHDEVVCEELDGSGSVGEVETILCQIPTWLEGCPVTAKGWQGKRYRKG